MRGKFFGDSPNTIAFLGHPAHELRVLGWFKKWRPYTILLTDGSGSDGKNRVDYTQKNLRAVGLSKNQLNLELTCQDKLFYRAITTGDQSFFRQRFDFLVSEIRRRNCQTVLCDGLEFYNSTHDLCREIARAAAGFVNRNDYRKINCYEVPLVDKLKRQPSDKHLLIDNDCFQLKLKLAESYHEEEHPSVKLALDELIEEYGLDSFREERISTVPSIKFGITEPHDTPFYEIFGQQRVEQGIYPSVITWDQHIKPIFEQLHRWANESGTLRCAS